MCIYIYSRTYMHIYNIYIYIHRKVVMKWDPILLGKEFKLDARMYVNSRVIMHCFGWFHIITPEMPKLSQH